MGLLVFQASSADAAPIDWQVYAAPHLASTAHELFYQSFNQHPLAQVQFHNGMKAVLRLQEQKQNNNTQRYWAQLRFDEQYIRYEIQLQLEVWRGKELLWQRARNLSQEVHIPGLEHRLQGQPVLTPYLHTKTGLLQHKALAPEALTRLNQTLYAQGMTVLAKELGQFLQQNPQYTNARGNERK